MLNTVQFHFGYLYRLFDEDEFLFNLYEFYDDAASKVQSNRLWYVQFLMILAFGEAFLAPVRRASNTASWTKYFSRAMSLLPDVTGLWQEPILSIEVLTLIGLYFHSVDMRDTAYVYVSDVSSWAMVVAKPADWPCNAHGFGGGASSRSASRATRSETG